MEIKEIIGRNIAGYRKERNLTQEDLARKMGTMYQLLIWWIKWIR